MSLLKTQFADYERNKLFYEYFLAQQESLTMRKDTQEEKINSYYKNQEKIKEHKKLDEIIVKSDLRIGQILSDINKLSYENVSLSGEINHIEDKISENKKTIGRIDEENEKLRILKIYGEISGKNGISKQVMRTMLPVINQELQRVLMDC